MNNKRNFIDLELSVISFRACDVIATSDMFYGDGSKIDDDFLVEGEGE